MVFHVLNRGARRRDIFSKDADFAAFEKVMHESMRVRPMRLRRNRPKLLASFATPQSCSVLNGFVQRVSFPGLRWSLRNPAIVVSLVIGMLVVSTGGVRCGSWNGTARTVSTADGSAMLHNPRPTLRYPFRNCLVQ